MKLFDYLKFLKRYNTLKLKYENLLETTQSEVYENFMKKIKESEELRKLKEENKSN